METPTETSSTRTLRPDCKVADLVPKSMDTGKTPARHRDGDPDRNLLDAHPASLSTGTVLATLHRGRLGPRVDGHREDSSSASRWRPRLKPPRSAPCVHQHGDRAGYFASWPTRSPSRWTQGRLQLGIEMETPTETSSKRTLRPSARGPCGLLRARIPCALSSRRGPRRRGACSGVRGRTGGTGRAMRHHRGRAVSG